MSSSETTDSSINYTKVDSGPVPLSFPAFLRNSGVSSRFAYLHPEEGQLRAHTAPVKKKSSRRDENDGKRWIRRKENARFAGNPHIVLATKKDYTLSARQARSTFPEPLPPYLPRTSKVPPIMPPSHDPYSANAGRFSLSLKGMRRELRKAGAKTESLVREVESEMVDWLRIGGTVLSPDINDAAMVFPETPVTNTGVITEVSRTPLQLVWYIGDNAFARYVVHCCARYYEIISFSKDISGRRLTYLLRPNVTRPDYHAASSLATPPATDMESSSYEFEAESDLVLSDWESKSEVGKSEGDRSSLSVISEDADVSGSPRVALPADDQENGSVIGGDTDGRGDESGSEFGLSRDMDSFSLQDRTPRAFPRQRSLRARVWDQGQTRSASSPSRSPARRVGRQLRKSSAIPARTEPAKGISFYDYLFL